jgi:4-hydroxythreonine-4-phosphate dehydrogenase
MTRPRIGITVGDPAGIGPEIAEAAMANPRVGEACEPVRYGPSQAEARAAFVPGALSAEAGRTAYQAIVAAVQDAQAGRIDGIATAPINKAAFAKAGLAWPGHTELLAHLCGVTRVAMLFHAAALRVVLATVHVALRDVPALLTPSRLRDVIDLTVQALPRFGFVAPRLAVAGLNPHAGEHGLMGHEDDAVIVPVVADCRERGVNVQGPIPADTVFVRASRGEFDAVIACYHDQGLIPVKLLGFGSAVNVTIGLPIVRTSVDHGTAFDIAGRGLADPGSLVEAVLLAARLAKAGGTRSTAQ